MYYWRKHRHNIRNDYPKTQNKETKVSHFSSITINSINIFTQKNTTNLVAFFIELYVQLS